MPMTERLRAVVTSARRVQGVQRQSWRLQNLGERNGALTADMRVHVVLEAVDRSPNQSGAIIAGPEQFVQARVDRCEAQHRRVKVGTREPRMRTAPAPAPRGCGQGRPKHSGELLGHGLHTSVIEVELRRAVERVQGTRHEANERDVGLRVWA